MCRVFGHVVRVAAHDPYDRVRFGASYDCLTFLEGAPPCDAFLYGQGGNGCLTG